MILFPCRLGSTPPRQLKRFTFFYPNSKNMFHLDSLTDTSKKLKKKYVNYESKTFINWSSTACAYHIISVANNPNKYYVSFYQLPKNEKLCNSNCIDKCSELSLCTNKHTESDH